MNILLINYDFPPNPGIGGRRWAKLAKYLAIGGHRLHVVKAALPDGVIPSAWSGDVTHPNIQIHSADRKYPKSLSHPQSGWLGKIKFHTQKKIMQWREKGTIYDQSIGWQKTMFPICRTILQTEKIDAVIATGAPWNLLVYAAQLKVEFPHVRLLVDYRDPWLTAKNYGMAALKNARMNAEIRKQKFVFEHADIVTTPYEYLTEELLAWCKERCSRCPRFATLAHFFDEQDFHSSTTHAKEEEVFRVVYAGDVYVGSEPQWRELEHTIERMERMGTKKQLRFDLYTQAKMPERLTSLKSIRMHAPVGKEIFSIMQRADALLIVLPENKKDERTTKFFEYLPLRKPLFIIAPEGEVTHFVEANQLGVNCHQPESDLYTFFNGDYYEHSFNQIFSIETHTAHNRANEVISMLT